MGAFRFFLMVSYTFWDEQTPKAYMEFIHRTSLPNRLEINYWGIMSVVQAQSEFELERMYGYVQRKSIHIFCLWEFC